MIGKLNIKKFFQRQDIQLSEKEVEKKYKEYQTKLLEKSCSFCQKKFNQENIKSGNTTIETTHTDYYYPVGCQRQTTYYQSECFFKKRNELKKLKIINLIKNNK